MQKFTTKQTFAAAVCATALVASLSACSGEGSKAAPVGKTSSSPLTATTSRPVANTPTTTKPKGKATAPLLPAGQATNTYGGLKVVVNLPTDISSASRPRVRLFSAFLQAVGRTTAQNKIDPSVSRLASVNVVKSVQAFAVHQSAQAIGSVTFTVSTVQTGTSGMSVINGCVNQSKVVQVRRDGSHYVTADVKKYPTRKMTAGITPGKAGPKVTVFTFAPGTC